MPRYAYQSHFVDGNGTVVPGGTVTVYKSGTSTLATIYESSTGAATSSSMLTTDSNDGSFKFYVDTADYSDLSQKFRIMLSKTNFRTQTYDDIVIFPDADGFARPEHYGTIDGDADEVQIQAAIDSGKPVLLTGSQYVVTDNAIVITSDNFSLYGPNAEIKNSSTGVNTFRFGATQSPASANMQWCNIQLNKITNDAGSGHVFEIGYIAHSKIHVDYIVQNEPGKSIIYAVDSGSYDGKAYFNTWDGQHWQIHADATANGIYVNVATNAFSVNDFNVKRYGAGEGNTDTYSIAIPFSHFECTAGADFIYNNTIKGSGEHLIGGFAYFKGAANFKINDVTLFDVERNSGDTTLRTRQNHMFEHGTRCRNISYENCFRNGADIYDWVASGSGTNEYYLTLESGNGDPSIPEPPSVAANGTELNSGTVGSLSASEWDYGDNDSLGYNTIYVRLSDGSDPDSSSMNWWMDWLLNGTKTMLKNCGSVSSGTGVGIDVNSASATIIGHPNATLINFDNTTAISIDLDSGSEFPLIKPRIIQHEANPTYTVVAGAITTTSSRCYATTGGAGAMDLDTINTSLTDSDEFRLILSIASGSDAITLKNGTDNLDLSGGDIVLSDSDQVIELIYNSYTDKFNVVNESYTTDTTAAGAGTDGTISSRSAGALGECDGFVVIGGKYIPYWDDITP